MPIISITCIAHGVVLGGGGGAGGTSESYSRMAEAV